MQLVGPLVSPAESTCGGIFPPLTADNENTSSSAKASRRYRFNLSLLHTLCKSNRYFVRLVFPTVNSFKVQPGTVYKSK